MSVRVNRRQAIAASAAITAGYWITDSQAESAQSANDKLNIAVIGVGGRGSANVGGVKNENIVAMCDVDSKRAGKAFEQFRSAGKFTDFRKMYDAMENQIDAVVISTPDHTHFHPAYRALQMGKHVYLEKPMAHSVWECRTLTDLAAEQGVATQLGVQRHTLKGIHRSVELIKAGAIGTVTEVYSWVGGDRGMPGMPTKPETAPAHLDWDLWLGPAAEREFQSTYAPYGWRFWWDFGTGETGNWGCHILDIPFWALDLKYPVAVGASGPNPHDQMTPKAMDTWFQFPANEQRPAVKLHWSHTKSGPEILRKHNLNAKGCNTLFVGTEGMLLCGFGRYQLLPEKKFADYQRPAASIADSPGFHKEWLAACRGGEAATCHFGYSGPLAETVLLGNVAYRAQTEFTWDAEKLSASDPKAQRWIKTAFRKGWEI